MEEENDVILVNNPMPHPSSTKGVKSEIRVERDEARSQASQEVKKTEVLGGRSRATGNTTNAEILKRNRKIERLERELRELKDAQEGYDRQLSRRQRSRSHSGSCESSHRFPKQSEKDHRAQKNSRRSRLGERTRKTSPLCKPEKKDHNPVWKQLQQISHSPFSSKIERAKLPAKFTPPNLISYNGNTDPVSHLSHYRQSMTLYNGNDSLMCRIFPSSLGEVALQKPKEVDSLMALIMKPGESLKSYSARYWETYNEIDLCGEDLAVRQFKFGLPIGCKIRQSLTKKPPLNMTDLMSRIEQHVRVEEDGLQPQKKPDNNISAPKNSVQLETSRAKMAGDPAFRESKPYLCLPQGKGSLDRELQELHGILGGVGSKQTPPPICGRHQAPTTTGSFPKTEVCEGATPAPKRLRKEMTKEIIFTDHDLEGVQLPHSDALVVTMQIGNFHVKRIIIDPGSSAEIMYDSLFRGLGLGHGDLDRKVDPLYGFSGESVMPIGRVTVKVHAGTISSLTEFWVLNFYSPYNAILGRPWLHKMKAISSTLHQRLRFRTPEGIMEIRGDQVAAKQCLIAAAHQKAVASPYEAPGVDPAFACHNLNVDPLSRPVVQKGRRLSPLHKEAMCEEVNRLIEAGAIKEILYPTWLSNTVVVKKNNRKWRVCIDFTDLNKACPKDPFPLPKIDQLVDATSNHQRMSFLDAFQGYHQIAMNPADQEKTAFITPRGIFCYKVMPFGLKNAGATYQRMITRMFVGQMEKTVEVYIDDMVVKSVLARDHLSVGSGKFLGFIITQRGIESKPGPDHCHPQLKATENYQGSLEANWNGSGFKPFHFPLKAYLIAAPLLAIPVNGESLYMYLAAFEHAVSAAIVREDYSVQRPVYYTSKTLDGAESRYLLLEKLAFALADPLHVFCDSQLVVNQISGEYAAKDEKMVVYLTEARRLLGEFKHVQVEHIRRDLKGHVDALASLASAVAPELRRIIFVGVQNLLSVGRKINNGVEVEPLTHITDADSKKFVWKNIITCFGIPRVVISDNETQFDSELFKKFYEQYGIKNHFSTPAYPQGNGHVESSNKTLLDGIKKRLEKAKGRWVEELPSILWTYRTTPRSSTRETPFSLIYGVEAVIPLEIGLPTIHTEYYDPITNETSLATDLNLAEERRDSALIHLATYQNELRRMYKKRVNFWELAVGDLVLRKVIGSRRDATHGKLGPNWEGPYKITSVASTGAFRIEGPNNTPVKRPWNICVIKDSLSKDHDHQGTDKKVRTGYSGTNKKVRNGHPGKNAHDKSPSCKAKTLTRSGVIKDSLSKDHDH
uniref:Integrase catalytic domain-containing protein n=1 Tax=Fagus sylvatica TaxID=28930 RepID=A0A2N9I869_FAGSY